MASENGHTPEGAEDVIEMAHEEVTTRFEDYFVGSLDAPEQANFVAHVRNCDGCQRTFDRWSSAEEALEGDLALLNRTRGRLLTEVPARAPKRVLPTWLGVVGAALTVGVVVVAMSPVEQDTLRVRGAGVAADPSQASFRVLIGRIEEGRASVVDLGSAGVTLAPKDRLRFVATTQPSVQWARVFVIGYDGVATPLTAVSRLDSADNATIETVDWTGREAIPRRFVAVFGATAAQVAAIPGEDGVGPPWVRAVEVGGY